MWHVWFHDVTVLRVRDFFEIRYLSWELCHCDIVSEFLHTTHKSSTNVGYYVVSWSCLGLESRCLGLGLGLDLVSC